MEAKTLQNQKGFTLVEIAIVLVIIGLLLGGVLKGQELIENSKIKAAKADADKIVAAIHGYQDRFRALPGDDPNGDTNAGVTGGNAGDGDGLIQTDELADMWLELRGEQFISGSGNANPTSAFGGAITVESSAAGLVVCQSGLTAEQQGLVDTRYDDADGTTGIITGGTSTAISPALAYTDATATHICITY